MKIINSFIKPNIPIYKSYANWKPAPHAKKKHKVIGRETCHLYHGLTRESQAISSRTHCENHNTNPHHHNLIINFVMNNIISCITLMIYCNFQMVLCSLPKKKHKHVLGNEVGVIFKGTLWVKSRRQDH